MKSKDNTFEYLNSKRFGGAVMVADKGTFVDDSSLFRMNMAYNGGALAASSNSRI